MVRISPIIENNVDFLGESIMALLLSLVFLDLLRGCSLLEVVEMFLDGFVLSSRFRARTSLDKYWIAAVKSADRSASFLIKAVSYTHLTLPTKA